MRSKALLLLFIFLLNTAIGFACALLMSGHAQEETAARQESGHHNEPGEAAGHHHSHDRTAAISAQHHPGQTYIAAQDDPCCQGLVNSLNTLAKVLPLPGHFDLLSPLFYVAAFFLFFLIPVSDVQKTWSLALYKRRRPPNHPIRIAIQSFQI